MSALCSSRYPLRSKSVSSCFFGKIHAASMATSVSRNFRAVSQLAGDPARELAALVRIREGGGFEMSLQILVANPLQVKFSAQNDLEQAAVFRADRTQSPKTPRGFDRSTDRVQDAVRSFWFSHYRERLQIALIRRATQLDAPT